MSIFSAKPIESWTEEDLLPLVEQRVEERQNIEYKLKSYGRSDGEVKEMLADISSIANAYGGYLLIGIEENDRGCARALAGIDECEMQAQRIVDTCLAGIEPRITGIKTRCVLLEGGKAVLCVFIPRSHRAPHMVVFKRSNKFWVRHDRRKDTMTVAEIKDAFTKSHSIMDDVQEFLALRRHMVGMRLGTQPYLLLSATPILVNTEIIDISDPGLRNIVKAPQYSKDGVWNFREGLGGIVRPTLNGLKRGTDRWEIEVFRNGYIETTIPVSDNTGMVIAKPDGGGDPTLNAYAIVGYILSFCHLVSEIRAHIGLEEPFVMNAVLQNIKHIGLRERPLDRRGFEDTSYWKMSDLPFYEQQVAVSESYEELAQSVADRLWQAFGFENAFPVTDVTKD